ncbi:FtsX-like permease family protein [Actinomycetota bacterium]
MLELALASLRTQARRFIAPGLAVILGVAFLASSLMLAATATKGLTDSIAGSASGYAAVVSPADDVASLPASTVATVRGVPGVKDVDEVRYGAVRPRGDSSRVVFLTTPPAPGSKAHLVEGRMPASPTELAIPTATRDKKQVRVGQTQSYSPVDGGAVHTFTVVGVVDTAGDFMYSGGGTYAFATSTGVAQASKDDGFVELDVTAAPGTSDEALAAALDKALPDKAVARTGAEQAAYLRTKLTGGTDVLRYLLLGFAGIALFVSSLVIANTFAILLARRTRETALLRCVGATRGQLLRSMGLEALIVGVTASAIGVAVGTGLAWLGVKAMESSASTVGMAGTGLIVRPVDILLPLLVGTLVTLIAGLAPLRRATRVTPLAALRPDLGVTAGSRAGKVRIGFGLLALVAGVVLLVLGVRQHQLLFGLPGGALSFLGIILIGSLLVPAVVRALGAVARRLTGVPGELAVDNAVRNRSRTANTASALLVGVTLIATMTVGAATMLRSVDAMLNSEMAIDVVATAGTDSAVPDKTERLVADVPSVAGTSVLRSGEVTVGKEKVTAMGVDAAGLKVIRDAKVVDPLTAGEVVLKRSFAEKVGTKAGERVRISSGSTAREFTVAIAGSMPGEVTMPAEELATITPTTTPIAVLAQLDEGADPAQAVADIESALEAVPGVSLSGTAQTRQQFVSILDTILAVAAALLAVAVVIAVVGVANTLSLSVLERGQEHALLRALGLTRGQLRTSVAIEATLIALVGALLGIGLGIAYGWAGAQTLVGGEFAITLGLPWARLAMIVAAALVAGLLASLLPSRRAARVAPAAALAQE